MRGLRIENVGSRQAVPGDEQAGRRSCPRSPYSGPWSIVGFVVSSAVLLAMQDNSPQSAATEAPEYELAGAPDTPGGSAAPVAFNVEPSGVAGGDPEPRPRQDLALAAESLIGDAATGGLQEPVRLPRNPAHHPIRRRPLPGLQLHAHVGRHARAALHRAS